MPETRWLDSEEFAAWYAFLTAYHRLEKLIEEQLKSDAGVTHPQYEIMVALSAAPERQLRMTELARLVVVSKSALTYQIGQLEKSGMVRRTDCPDDERGVLAVLTEQGLHCLRRLAPGHVDVVRKYLIDTLTRDELASLTSAMGKANRAMGALG
ncbi:MarR family transcriptional regulator [Spongiactinospora sp. TRM90649]|uniref:MarR family winged helix-turn-helix transcriptional regulator n=1 Tax=Spongiactinospora sp. TRM90649 TaxID=3031114 RepID=UPI0023F760AC|nr:MarR family transcriptional regulator [Spongiactinospora sp. TRM90649]MDF5759160.1 MarR family transcriptional regulator [Spongiactinospora sp. TRM90649]